MYILEEKNLHIYFCRKWECKNLLNFKTHVIFGISFKGNTIILKHYGNQHKDKLCTHGKTVT